jgi:hypothetical protein
MGPARAGKHGGRCVWPIPGSPRSHLNGTRPTSFPGCLRAASHEKVARNRLQLRTPVSETYVHVAFSRSAQVATYAERMQPT